ncbi:MAG: VanZ family protein [Phycisphaerales bacterium]|nr:VanZ family protein [Phycisphaerales bacterium]
MTVASRLRPWARAAFLAYALALVTLTHWPNLTIDGPVPRTDLWIHIGAFGLWASLLGLCAFFGAWLSWRNIALTWFVALLYATLDETTQGLPGIGRHVALDDWFGNALGITLACGAMALLARTRREGGP